ncbi:MAG: toll/interleukin-1 receptor domain-containing protein [Bacteroidales bacterium]|nr:toll/interleukin-1 receptor domain-containing protein [Bacteroidales bacterium]
MTPDYKYFAFISYSSADSRWGRRVQRKMEGYRMPATLCSEHGWERQPLKPVFFSQTDIQPGDLGEELKMRLQSSKNLIVIASPRSAQSQWVAKEIAYFHGLPQGRNIFFFIVDGKPMSGDPQTECYNPVVFQLGMNEPLGVNIHEKVYSLPWLNRERAYIQLITKLLAIEFDNLWHRHRRRQRGRAALCFFGFALAAASTALLVRSNGTTDVHVSFREATPHNASLEPRRDAVVRLWLDGEERRDTLHCESDSVAPFAMVARRMLGKEVRVTFECFDFESIDTVMPLSEQMVLPYRRDANLFGHVEFTLVDRHGQPLVGHEVAVGGIVAMSDAEGVVRMDVPVDQQRQCYGIAADVPLLDTILTMPCGGSGLTVKAL